MTREEFETWLHNKTVPSYTRDGEYRPHIRNDEVRALFDLLAPKWVPAFPVTEGSLPKCIDGKATWCVVAVESERGCYVTDAYFYGDWSLTTHRKGAQVIAWMPLPPLPEDRR